MNPPLSHTAPLALTLPLRGSHLIEASAGTGKTFTIALLYVRLVLGHGGETHGFDRALTPPEILVVTFTEAATQELRDRIRARLAEAAQCFRADPLDPNAIGDEPLRRLRDQYPSTAWPTCARKLEVAAEWMDEAAVSTIHGWCNRMLHEHAFDSLSLFAQTLETDPSEMRGDVVRDYWRKFHYTLTPEEATQITDLWADPDALERAVTPLLHLAEKLPAAPAPADALAQNQQERLQMLKQLKAPWVTWVDELKAQLEEARANKRFNGTKLRSSSYLKWLTELREWATSEREELKLTTAAWDRLTPQGIAEAWVVGEPLSHPALLATDSLRRAFTALPTPKAALLSHAARWVATELEATQRSRSLLGFDDLLGHLQAALDSPNGSRLADIIRAQFPVALIDEFQDTDPVQFDIFDRIYHSGANRQDCGLILIGDPKQAIYAFRGADIHTYLQARQAVGERLHTLDTNHRSTQALVDATNHCFAQVEQDTGSEGAFLFRRGEHNPVPFRAVQARGQSARFLVAGETPAAMQMHVLPVDAPLSKAAYIDQMAEIGASQLVHWLNLGQSGEAGFVTPGHPLVPVQPGDIAILVSNRQEADRMRQALSIRGVRSVYLSDKDTVYETPQAQEVYRWLLACADPDNDRLMRAALATPTLGLDFQALEALQTDETVWETRLLQFRGYHDLWQQHGVLPLIRRILFDFDCARRLLPLPADPLGQSGERILTDLLHLAELLQQASTRLEGEHALTAFLAEQIAHPQGEGDDRKMRLESDAHLVQVITIHKSKGLEYPLVMLPFICASRPVKLTDQAITWHDDQGELHVGLAADESTRALADRERLGEDLRKLYVALTRARHLTWMGLAPLETTADSALAHLFGLQHTPASGFAQAMTAFTQGQPEIQVVTHPNTDKVRFKGTATTDDRGLACRPRRAAREHWWISSYSGLPIGGQRIALPDAMDDTPRTDNWLEAHQAMTTPTVGQHTGAAATSGAAMHRFPKGAQPGTFLHDLMEWCANTGWGLVLTQPQALRDMISQRCATQGWDTWVDPLCDWVQQLLTTPLPMGGTSVRLEELTTARAEMEFWIETRELDLQALDNAVISHTLSGRARPALSPDSLTGMFKGFMDLVFEYESRYYVADYKSNWLGHDESAYNRDSMDEAIRAHRYDLQYVLYLFALHRLLTARLPDYDYDRHVGGALYLFMRGIAAPTAGVHFERPPKVLMQQLDRLFAGHSGGDA